MKVVILEDEKTAAKNLSYLLKEIDNTIIINKILDKVSDAIDYFSTENNIDLAFFDIHLADGISFEIFEKVKVDIPIIFTTAYDEYALKAFKVNSIDYILKPIDELELFEALQKFKSNLKDGLNNSKLKQVLQILNEKKRSYKTNYLVRQRDTLIPLNIDEIAYFTIETGIVKAVTFSDRSYVIEQKLDDIEKVFNPDFFFRANRQYIVNKKAIENLKIYFNGKLILNLTPKSKEQIIISKAKAPQLKAWIS